MIFNREDIEFYTQYSDDQGTIYYRLHKPSGVFFQENWSEGEHNYFGVAALTKDGKITDAKYFYKKTQEEFFEAVKYFESLISKRTPPAKQNPPSMGIFVFSKGDQLASFIKISDLVVEMSNEDVYKAFTPPKTKPFGKLDITILDDPKYDPVKYKFACNYDEKLSKELAETAKVSIDELFVYQLTAYQTQEGSESNPGDPASVSDQQLNPGDIEGETPQDLKGNPDDSGQERQPGDDQGGELVEIKVDSQKMIKVVILVVNLAMTKGAILEMIKVVILVVSQVTTKVASLEMTEEEILVETLVVKKKDYLKTEQATALVMTINQRLEAMTLKNKMNMV
jgi:hypothetical protein